VTDKSHTLYIAGAGIHPPGQLSLETVEALQSCVEIWTNIPESLHRDLPVDIAQVTKGLSSFYKPGRPRIENYLEVVSHILERVLAVSRVGYLTQGHPLIFDSVASKLISESPLSDVSVTLLPGISCIDTILVDVIYDPAKGLQVYEATGFVRNRIVIDPRAALLLLQPSVFDSRTIRMPDATGPDLAPLAAALRTFYPAEHSVLFVRSATGTMSQFVTETTVADVASVPAAATLGSSIFLRPTGAPHATGSR
jgi:uncharacterized protein YabN with tetrapyrrole methylase and pyrophosphatase domain